MTTKLLQDILREPSQMIKCVDMFVSNKRVSLSQAAAMLDRAAVIYVVGVGSSWNASIAVASMLSSSGSAAIAADASELLHFADLPEKSSFIVLSRSGESIEVVKLIEKIQAKNLCLIGITNSPESSLAQRSDLALLLEAPFDHLVSINMYSLLGLVGCLVAEACAGTNLDALQQKLNEALRDVDARMDCWRSQLEAAGWVVQDSPVYFIARGTSVASCHEARLLWEEAAKTAASALTTGSFRHGSQEMVRPGVRIGMLIQDQTMRDEDLRLASDLRDAGVSLMLVGADLDPSFADLVLEIPAMPDGWQFLADIIPLQLAAERTSRARGEDCDQFHLCPYIIADEGGLVDMLVVNSP